MENARHCLIAVAAQGTKSGPETEERRARQPDTLDTELVPVSDEIYSVLSGLKACSCFMPAMSNGFSLAAYFSLYVM